MTQGSNVRRRLIHKFRANLLKEETMRKFLASLVFFSGVAVYAADGRQSDCGWTILGFQCSLPAAPAFAQQPDCGFEGCGVTAAEVTTVYAQGQSDHSARLRATG